MAIPGTAHDAAVGHDAAIPGPAGLVMRNLPACVLGLLGIPLLAWFVPRNAGRDWWALGIIVGALLVMYGAVALSSRSLPKADPAVGSTQTQRAISSARTHGSLPSDPALRMMAGREACVRIHAVLVFSAVLAGIACGALVRPDLDWISPIGGLLVLTVLGWVRLPSAWGYLRLHARHR
ncbi:hypothetical protein [Kocuria rhizophila]|uniref:hypothetical protein n=1 Tax=Kocuria rhizophila TaxID=72000 RepID=UPI001EF54F19|nr:hypothetical protein [Kocuria rhizophila]MCG7425693.1 hypothetical protein [Kocuria rhizophila]MCT1455899.1 hypothetical protein [Kocuria rhizophila]MCT1879499.1 hypothetical protein [Kocuria rhizophila]MCT2248973.1 hypothetical protein [Kocuria rhizophila]